LRVCRASRSPPIRAERSITPSVSRWRCINRNCGGSCVMPKACCLGRAGAAFGSSVEPQVPRTLNWAPQPNGTSSRKGCGPGARPRTAAALHRAHAHAREAPRTPPHSRVAVIWHASDKPSRPLSTSAILRDARLGVSGVPTPLAIVMTVGPGRGGTPPPFTLVIVVGPGRGLRLPAGARGDRLAVGLAATLGGSLTRTTLAFRVF